MVKKRFILENLTRPVLLGLAEGFGVSGLSGKRKEEIVSVLSRKRKARLNPL